METEEYKDFSHISLDKTKDYFFAVRHGERADRDGTHYDDIPLTDHGKEQARAAGKILNELLSRSEIAKITVICSPYLRAIQTCNEVSKECSLNKIKIDMEFMESLYPHVFKESPLKKLDAFKLTAEEMKENYLYEGIEIILPTAEEWEEAETHYPEEVGADFIRLYKGFDHVIKKYECEDKTASNVVILVGHGSMLKCVTDYVEPSDKLVDYCSIGCIEFDRDCEGKRLLINRFGGHIERKTDYRVDETLHLCIL